MNQLQNNAIFKFMSTQDEGTIKRTASMVNASLKRHNTDGDASKRIRTNRSN
jgi:hypothetical protein